PHRYKTSSDSSRSAARIHIGHGGLPAASECELWEVIVSAGVESQHDSPNRQGATCLGRITAHDGDGTNGAVGKPHAVHASYRRPGCGRRDYIDQEPAL